MIFATQYYRPPFPERHRWADDLALIRKTGFRAIYLTAPWAWIEPAPGTYEFDDLDELFERADNAGLQVIVNTWSEIQPLWIHRELPGSELVDHMGRRVVSSQLAYMNFGLTPGGCTDNPAVRERAGRFLTETASRYAGADNLLLWDCWNEIRWLTQSDGYVCYCAHTVAAYRAWLQRRFSDLDALNAAWKRRYHSWDDVIPAKLPTRTYTDVTAFGAFLTDRAATDLRWRADAVRAGDGGHPVIAHAAFPAIHCTGEWFEWEQALARGNDWELADAVDGWGASHFPAWIHPSPADYGSRIEASRCAAGTKQVWIAELQGGAASHGLVAREPVDAKRQARWVWSGIARGVKAVNFWCWRDEVFGRESGGFGIVGEDGQRDARLLELARTAGLLDEHADLLEAYRPDAARVGVVFEPAVYHLDWASQLGGGLGSTGPGFQAGRSLQGYLQALERLQVPYDVIEPAHAGDLSRYRLIVLPWPLVVSPVLGDALRAWVDGGGLLLAEAELDAFDANGHYRYPGERPFANALGLVPGGREPIRERTIPFAVGGEHGSLRATTWLQTQGTDGELMLRVPHGKGSLLSVGSYPALAYHGERDPAFESFVRGVVREAGVLPALSCSARDGEVVQWRIGRSGATRLVFLINEGDEIGVDLAAPSELFAGAEHATDLATGRAYAVSGNLARRSLRVTLDAGGHHLLRFEEEVP